MLSLGSQMYFSVSWVCLGQGQHTHTQYKTKLYHHQTYTTSTTDRRTNNQQVGFLNVQRSRVVTRMKLCCVCEKVQITIWEVVHLVLAIVGCRDY